MKALAYLSLSLITLAACKTPGAAGPTPSEAAMQAAAAALDSAQAGRASKCAKETFRAAQDALAEAKALAAQGDTAAAQQKANEAATLAEQAEAASPPGCDEPSTPPVDDPANPGGDPSLLTPAASQAALQQLIEVIYFDYNEATIREDSKEVLSRVGQALSADARRKLEIEGHTDTRGSTEYNLHLGERRARAVEKYLLTQGATQDQLTVISYGEERPTDFGETEEAHAKNRRAELVIR